MEEKEHYTNITSLFQRLGKASEAETSARDVEDVTMPMPAHDPPTYSLRNSTTPSIHQSNANPIPNSRMDPGVGGETPPTIQRHFSETPEGILSAMSNSQTLLGGRPSYTLLRQFAQGGCGEVWEGSQVVFPRVVALKKIRPDLIATYIHDEDMKQQVYRSFLQEALTTAVLEHPNIVPVYDFSLDSTGEPLLSMRLIRGRRWDHMIHDDRNMGRAEYLERHLPILVSVCQAVSYAHSKGVIHRDLKPSQVMIGEFGEVYLMDWGLALVVDEDLFFRDFPDLRVGSVAATRGGNPPLGGTPAYMAPEQAEMDPWKLGYHTDIFLLGSTFFYMLTGMAPRRSTQAELDASGLLALPIDPPHIVRPEWDIPEELGGICMKALERAPGDRYPSARHLTEEIQGWVTGASKRRESESLTRRAAEKFAHSEGDYAILTDCQSDLIRALGLWPQNREAGHLLEMSIQAFAESALEQEDLNLARLMALRLKSADVSEDILNEVVAMERLGVLATTEAEEAEVHIRELQASGDLYAREMANLESQRNALREVTHGLISTLAKLVSQMENADPVVVAGLCDSLLAFDPTILRSDPWALTLFNRAARVASKAGLEREAAILKERARSLA